MGERQNCASFSSGNWFFCTKFVQLPWLVKVVTQLCTSKKECNKLDLTAAQYWSIVMIGLGGLLLVVSTYMQFQLQVYGWGCQKIKTAILRHFILLSRVT
jgi:hypothetical protein